MHQYDSGGHNPDWEKCCHTCTSFKRDKVYTSHGWCQNVQNWGERYYTPSVSMLGSCDLHKESHAHPTE